MKLVSADEMKEIEERCAQVGLPPPVLMDNAGLAFAEEVREFLGGVIGVPILILIGPGNNGGDGLVAARHFKGWGAMVQLYLLSSRSEADVNYRLALERGIPVVVEGEDLELALLKSALSWAEVVVDALFGTGKTRPMTGPLADMLKLVEEARKSHSNLKVIALDLPSGLDADSGAVDPASIAADVTITLGYPKLGLFSFPGASFVGRLVIADIGIPSKLAGDISRELLTREWARETLPPRHIEAHKGSFGRVMVCAGSINYIGSAYLACEAVGRVGAGLVTLAAARSLHPILSTKLTEATHLPLPEVEPCIIGAEATDVLYKGLKGYDVLLIGCGLGLHPSTAAFLKSMLLRGKDLPPVVVDADGLTILSRTPDWWHKLPDKTVLTPHPGEMARLLGSSVKEIQTDRLQVAQRAAEQWGKVVAFKGAYTIIAAPDGRVRVSPWANPGLASAGTGDVLAGVIAGLLGQGSTSFDAAALGVYLHGAAADVVSKELGDAGTLASDLLLALPKVIKGLKEGS